MFQVCALLFVEARSNLVIDALVVLVYPCFFSIGQHLHIHQSLVVEAEGDGFEFQIFLSGRVCSHIACRNGNNKVLDTDTVLVGAVDAGFIGEDIAFLNGVGVIVGTDISRSFVTSHEMADAMTGTVTVGDTFRPHELVSQYV